MLFAGSSTPDPSTAGSGDPLFSESGNESVSVIELDLEGDGAESVCTVAPDLTVGDVKREIVAALGREKFEDLVLAFGMQSLSDDDRNLKSYGIQNGDEISFNRPAAPKEEAADMKTATLFFKDMNGSNFCINEIPLSLTVSGLQELVGKDRAWDPSTLRFLFFGKELKAGDQTLESYLIENESTLHIVSRVRGG